MNCDFAEKISMLLDCELSEQEGKQVRGHIADCDECRGFERDVLLFRSEIREIKNIAGNEVMLPEHSYRPSKAARKSRWTVSVPIPVLAAVVLGIVVIGLWLILSRTNSAPSVVMNPPDRIAEKTARESLARFDHGGRAEIYVTDGRQVER